MYDGVLLLDSSKSASGVVVWAEVEEKSMVSSDNLLFIGGIERLSCGGGGNSGKNNLGLFYSSVEISSGVVAQEKGVVGFVLKGGQCQASQGLCGNDMLEVC